MEKSQQTPTTIAGYSDDDGVDDDGGVDDHDCVDDDGDNTEDFRDTGNQILKDVTAKSGDRYVVVLMKREKTIRQNWE